MFSESPIVRRKSRQIMVGNVPVGGGAPISVQSMTNTSTADIAATVAQIKSIQAAGADIRVSVPSLEEAEAFGQIRQQVDIPLVADIHFDHNIALRVADLGVDCLRINPGNITREDRLREVIAKAATCRFPSASASTPVPWVRIYCASTTNPQRKPWLNRPCATWTCSTSTTSRTLKSA